MASSSTQPNTTLYLNNLNDKVNKEELRVQLYALFTTYGKIIDIIASKKKNMRGQAWLVFTDLAGATSALRACEGMLFYDKPLHIDYAKTKSYATLKREDPNFVPPTAANASDLLKNGKRLRDEQGADGEPQAKRERPEEDEEEMEIDEEEAPSKNDSSATPATVPQQVQLPSARLLCTNLPQEVTDDVLSVLFQQYQGFQTTQVTWSPTLSPTGVRVKMAQVLFESSDHATTAKEALDGFTLKKGWQMSVVYI